MLKAIIEELNKVRPCYSLETFKAQNAILDNFFIVVDIGEKEMVGRFGHYALFVYIYTPRESFYILKGLEREVWEHLHTKTLAKKDSEGNFWITFIKEVFKKVDRTINKQCACLEFRIPTV